MAKHGSEQPQRRQEPAAISDESEPKMITSFNDRQPVTMEQARHCPLCWTGVNKGTGVQYAADGSTKYYKCKSCGHTWTATIYIERIVIEHRKVEISTREDA